MCPWNVVRGCAALKGGCAHFTMCILHFQLIDLDLWNVFCEVSLWGNFLFTLQRQNKVCNPGERLWCKYIRNYLLVYQLTSHFLPYLRNYKEFEGEISDLQLEKYGLSFETKKYTTSGWAWGDENVIGIRAFKTPFSRAFSSSLRSLFSMFQFFKTPFSTKSQILQNLPF